MDLSYRNQSVNFFMKEVPIISIDLQSKSMDWFVYDSDLRHKRVEPQAQISYAMKDSLT